MQGTFQHPVSINFMLSFPPREGGLASNTFFHQGLTIADSVTEEYRNTDSSIFGKVRASELIVATTELFVSIALTRCVEKGIYWQYIEYISHFR